MIIPNNRLEHIFRNAVGHLPDTPANRKLLIDTASNPSHYLGTDKWGNEWYSSLQPDGSQVWGQARKGEIVKDPQGFSSYKEIQVWRWSDV